MAETLAISLECTGPSSQSIYIYVCNITSVLLVFPSLQPTPDYIHIPD